MTDATPIKTFYSRRNRVLREINKIKLKLKTLPPALHASTREDLREAEARLNVIEHRIDQAKLPERRKLPHIDIEELMWNNEQDRLRRLGLLRNDVPDPRLGLLTPDEIIQASNARRAKEAEAMAEKMRAATTRLAEIDAENKLQYELIEAIRVREISRRAAPITAAPPKPLTPAKKEKARQESLRAARRAHAKRTAS